VVTLAAAAVLGNTTNYAIGRWLGRRFLDGGGSRWVSREHLERTHAFYERFGGAAVVVSRFVPIIRTYVPFVAGVARMDPVRYTAYNVGGAVLWVASLAYAGFFFGNLAWVRANLSAMIVAIVVLSLVPLAVAAWKARGTSRP